MSEGRVPPAGQPAPRRRGLVGGASSTSGAERRPVQLSEADFDSTARALIEDAEQWATKTWRQARIGGWQTYHAEGPDKPAQSQTSDREPTVAYEVRDAVQQVLPDIMEQLAGGDEPVEFYSHDPSKHDLCRQATILALALFWESGGYDAIHDSSLHAAVGRLGFLKVFREEKICFEDHEFTGLGPDVVAAIAQQPGHLLLETEDEYESDMNGMPYLARRSGQVRRYYVEDRLRVDAPDPASMFATQCVELDEALCVGQRTTVRMGNLREMGFESGDLEAVSGHEDAQQRNERSVRTGEPQESAKDYGSWALRPVDLYEAYVKIDADGDGLLETWKVIAAGSDKRVLRRTRVTHQPYVGVNIRRSPHTIQGLSFADLLQDLQVARQRLTDALLENTELINMPMVVGSGTVDFTQLQRLRRLKVINEGVPGSVRFISPPAIAGDTLPVLEYLKQIRSERVGVDPAAQGLQPDQLTGVAAVAIAGAQNASARVVRYMVRTVAESGLRPTFAKLLRLMVGQGPRHVTGRDGQYVEVDPRAFDPAWQVRTRVGLGALAKQEKQQAYQQLLALAQSLVGAFGPQNPFITPDKLAGLIHDAVDTYTGLGATRFFNKPEEAAQFMAQQQAQPPPPDPKMLDVQRKQQADQQKIQLEQAKAQSEAQHQNVKAAMDHQAKADQISTKAQTDMAKVIADHRTKLAELAVETQLEARGQDLNYKVKVADRKAQGNVRKPQ